jgi:hypothetical protein
MQDDESSTYAVRWRPEPFPIDGDWDKRAWQAVEPVTLDNYMGDEPRHRPRVQAKVVYDDQALYVIFRVEDRYVRSVTTELHGPVCTDSCVEFFFTPGEDLAAGYLNLEINGGGTMLFCHQLGRDRQVTRVAPEDCRQITLAHSLPAVVEPEISDPVTWTLEYRLPLAVVAAYCPLTKPAPGVVWRANFHKIADATSAPHWLTWAKVENPTPDFHLPRYFGTLVFADAP